MKKANVSPLVLFLVIIALLVSIISFIFSLTEQLVDSRPSCDNVRLEVSKICFENNFITLDIKNTGPAISSLDLILWTDSDAVINLPESDLVSGASYRAAIPYRQTPTKKVLVPSVQGDECRSNRYVFNEGLC